MANERAVLDPLDLEEALILECLNGAESLRDFIRRLSPQHPPQRHLDPLIDAIERARHERVRVCISMPPRHGKTWTLLHAIAWWLQETPADRCAYFSYNATIATSKSRLARELAVRAGVGLDPSSTAVEEWTTNHGGGLIAGGRGSGLTGQGVSGLLIVDDPFKDREEADSALLRDRVEEWFNEVAFTRLEGGSVIVVHTRWHQDDLIGRLEKDGGWEVINLPAIAEENDPLSREPGEALWPEVFPRSELDVIAKRLGTFGFSALYQGHPRPRGATVFGLAHYYDPAGLIFDGWRIGIGADPAGTAKTTSDYSVAVVMALKGRKLEEIQARILHVYREQVEIPTFIDVLAALIEQWGVCPIYVEAVAGFKAVPQFLRRMDSKLTIKEAPVMGDKFQRAQQFAAVWNDGRVEVPTSATWLKDYLHELTRFTGVSDPEDDQVDASAHGFNGLVNFAPVAYSRPNRPLATRRM
jgi:predicted phage terminase large subunit-like protein